MLTFIYFVLILGIIVLVHEFGHFIFSKIFGVYVYEFSIGMGPRICGTKKVMGKTQYNLRLFPIGGFVQLAGEDPTEEDPEVPRGAYLYNKPVWQRAIIMGAGVFNNFVLAIICLFLIGTFYGAVDLSPTVTSLDQTYPMYGAGIREGDVFREVNGHSVSTRDDVRLYMALENNGEPMEFVMERDGVLTTYSIQPIKVREKAKNAEDDKNNEGAFKYGIAFENKLSYGFGDTINYTFTQFGSYIKQILVTFKYLFTGRLGLNNLAGPVGIYSVVGEATKTAVLLNMASLIALLSVNVGFLNIMPFPAFDGGRIVFLIIEKLRGKPVKPEIENMVNTVGFMLLMLLIVLITISDISKLFG
jgi:regulator of sigma E protease